MVKIIQGMSDSMNSLIETNKDLRIRVGKIISREVLSQEIEIYSQEVTHRRSPQSIKTRIMIT